MSVELQVIRASEFVRLDAHKHLDLGASKEVLRALALACRKRGIDRALMDVRTLPVLAKPHFTNTELSSLVGAFRDGGFSPRQRLAILYRHDVHGGIRNFAFISRMRGLRVQSFEDYEGALEWLSEDQAQEEHRQGEVPIPIVKKGQAKKLPVTLTVVQEEHPPKRARKVA